MKAAVMTEEHQIQVMDVPEPEPAPDQIKVKIAYCGVCGSELHMFDPEFAARRAPMPPRPVHPIVSAQLASRTRRCESCATWQIP